MEGLGLLAGQGPLFGRLDHRRLDRDARTRTGMPHGVALLVPATASEPSPRLASRTEGDPIQPVRQQVGISDRPGPAGQDQEDGLEGVLGMVAVAQDLAADVQDHRPVTRHQGGEGGFAAGIAPVVEPLEELAVGQTDDGTAVEQRPDLSDHRWCCHERHAVRPLHG